MKNKLLSITFLAAACSLHVVAQTTNSSVKANSEVNPILPYNLCADPTAVEYDGRLYVYGTNDQQELDITGDKTKNTYGKITQLVCMSTADMVNWTFHGTIDVKTESPWIATSWAPSIVSRVEEDGLTHFYLYYTNTASGIGVLTSTSPTGPWKDPLGKALINGSTPGRGLQSNIIDPGVCIDDNGVGWLTFGGGDPNRNGSTLMPGNVRIVKLGKNMISLDGAIKEIPAPFHFEANELNYINGKYVFSYSGGWNCNANDWNSYEGKNGYPCPGNCSILAMVTDDPMNGTWTYKGEILKNPGTFGYPWGNNHSHLQKFGNNYYMTYHTQYLEGKLGLSGGYRGIAIDKATVSESSSTISVSMTNDGPSMITANCPLANQRNEAEMIANCSDIKVVKSTSKNREIVVSDIDDGDWTEVRGMKFPESARSITVRLKGKGTIKVYKNKRGGTPLAVAEFDNSKLDDVTVNLSNVIAEGATCNYIFFVFYDTVSSSPIQFDSYQFNSQTAEEVTAIKHVNAEPVEATGDGAIYNISGQRVDNNAKGLVIKNGRAHIVK